MFKGEYVGFMSIPPFVESPRWSALCTFNLVATQCYFYVDYYYTRIPQSNYNCVHLSKTLGNKNVSSGGEHGRKICVGFSRITCYMITGLN